MVRFARFLKIDRYLFGNLLYYLLYFYLQSNKKVGNTDEESFSKEAPKMKILDILHELLKQTLGQQRIAKWLSCG